MVDASSTYYVTNVLPTGGAMCITAGAMALPALGLFVKELCIWVP